MKKLTRRKYKVNESYFDRIDTPDKAYWLGFIYADGHNSKREDSITIGLKESDASHLYKFRESIGSDHNIKIYNCTGFNPHNKVAILQIYSKSLSKCLKAKGCVHNKTDRLEFPDIPKSLCSHFVRGYFDGDGCITYLFDKKGFIRLRFYIAVNDPFSNQLKELLESILGIRVKLYDQGKIKRLYVFKQKHILKLLEWIYNESTISLDRKNRQSNLLINLYNLDYKKI